MSLKYIHCSEFLQKYQNVRLIPINTSLGKEEGIIEVYGYSSNRIGFQHYWLEIDGYIIDLVEDQFKTFPNNPKVSVYSKPNNNYKQRKVHG